MTNETHETQFCFPAVNSSCIKTKQSTLEYNIMYVFFSLLSVWTVFLNLLVIFSITHFKNLHTPTNLLILSLTVSDMLVGVIVIPVEAIKLVETCWYFGDVFCGLFIFIMGVLLSTSFNNLLIIAIDRFVAVCYPLQYERKITTSRTLMCICLCWFFSTAYNTAVITVNKYFDTSNKTNGCYGECAFVMGFAWAVVDQILFILPCIVLITLYLRIFYVAKQQVKVINSLMKSGTHLTVGSVKRKSESKAALTLGIIVLIHLLCWLSVYIFSLIWSADVPVVNSIIWTVFCNSSLNPLVYALFYPWFRRAMKHILTFKIFRPASSLVNILADHHS